MRGSRSCVSSYLFSPFDQSVTRCRYGSRWSVLAVSPAILVVADLFHPVDEGLPIDQFLNGGMRHRSGWGSTVPMLFTGWDPSDIAGMDLLNGAPLVLDPTAAGGDNEDLTQR